MAMPRSTSRRQLMLDALAGAGVLGLSSLGCATSAAGATGTPSSAGSPQPAAVPTRPGGGALPTGDVRDFDFLVGAWTGANRRLKQRWVGSTDWDTFPGQLRCESRMGGVVNIDEVDFATKGWSGMSVRVFNLEQRRWYIYWINNRTGTLFPPVVGGFTGNRGEFYGDDTDDGKPVKVQFLWTITDANTARWQQAFSLDGKQWETNWSCDFTRATT